MSKTEMKELTSQYLATLDTQLYRIIFNQMKTVLDKYEDPDSLRGDDFIYILSQTLRVADGRMLVRYKSILRNFLTYCDGNATEEQLEDLSRVSYKDISIGLDNCIFKNFQDLWDTLEYDLSQFPRELDASYDTARAIIYLTFYGVSKEELIEIKKDDLKENENKIIVGEREVEIDPQLSRFLGYYKNSAGYKVSAKSGSLKFCWYKDTDYLLRNKTSEKLNTNTVFQTVSKLNRNIDAGISLVAVAKSGRMYRYLKSGKMPYDRYEQEAYQMYLNTFYKK